MHHATSPYYYPPPRPSRRGRERQCRLHNGVGVLGQAPAHSRSKVREIRQQAKETMLAKGRCQHQVDHLSNSHDPETFAYMAALEVSQRRLRDHTLCYGCAACVAYDTNKAAYQVQHVISTCRCPMISTPYERLIKTIRNGGIPLLSIDHTAESGATPQIQVHARKRASKYVAISHVWADGLGNPYANALPLCQIQRLHTHLTALKTVVGANYVGSNGPCLFWMDTLCIPVAEKHSSLRLLQIDKMASIYTGAATTLILDAELMSIVRNAPALSTALRARIACSVWMSRSWTLQEGKLSPSIAVQFANDAVVLDGRLQQDGTRGERRTDGSVEEMSRARELASGAAVPVILEDQLGKGALPSSCDCVDLALERAFLSTLFPNTRSILHAEDFVKAWNELAGRSTTMATDVPIILTNILNFNNREILKYREPAAMFQAILLSMKYLPLGIFFNTGPRHNPSGNHRNRWVPVVVGKERLVEHGELQIFPSYLLYRYWNSDGGTGTPAYMIDGVLRLHSKVYLHAKSRGIYYAVELPLSFTDHFDTAEINSTCILIEGNLLTQDSSIKRGACFYVRNGIRATSSATCEIGPSGIGLIFQSPLRLIQLADAESAEIDHGHAYILSEITSNCDFRISYDPLPRFKRLFKRREGFRWGKTAIWCCFVASLAFAVVVLEVILKFTPGYSHAVRGLIVVAVYVGFIFLAALANFILPPQIEKRRAWKHTRSFEEMASRRTTEGAV